MPLSFLRQYTSIITILMITICSGCLLTTSIKNGEMAYDRKQYAVAIEMLTEEYDDSRNSQLKARKAYLIGQSYSLTGESKEAVKWLERATSGGHGPEATKALAYAYKKSGRYTEAIGAFESLKEMVDGRNQEIDREINVCKQITLWQPSEDYAYDIDLVRASSKDADYGAVLFEDEYLIFTSDRKGSTGEKTYKWTGGYHSDLYIVSKRGGSARKFDAILNSDHNDGTACFSQDYTDLYFTRCYSESETNDAYCKIMYSRQQDGVWTLPQPLPFMIDGHNYGQPTLIESDSVMVFSADLPESLGGHDLFYVQKVSTPDSSYYWSDPAPMPANLNTQGEELFPTGDGDTLYFSSDYHAGYGGLDIFKTYLTPTGWSTPENLRTPINSSEDDYSFVVDYTTPLRGSVIQTGYFTSSRKGLGYDDIYKYEKRRIKPPVDTVKTDPKTDPDQYILNLVISTQTPALSDPSDPNSDIEGYESLKDVQLTITDSQGKTQTATTTAQGRYIIAVVPNTKYTIKASKTDYLNSSKGVSTYDLVYPEGELSITINTTLVLQKIFYDQEIVLDNIYYDFNKWNIRKDATPTLDTLAMLLLDNPQLDIELSSHTDCRGDDEYNMILSQKRAQSVVDYIVGRNVRSGQLTPRGYGETLPNINCQCDSCTEDEHQKNRRTSFKILQ